MADEIEIVQVKMPSGNVMETDMATIEFVRDFNAQYSGGTVCAPWSEIMKMSAAHEYLRQQGGAQ
jgi:hypothetical protein